MYTVEPCTNLQRHFIQSVIGRGHVCLPVTYHLNFWQNDRSLLLATAVTRGWNGYRNQSQHKKLTLEKKILLPLLRNSNPGPSDQESGALTTELSLLPGTVAGYGAGARDQYTGSGSNRLCMTKEPVFDYFNPKLSAAVGEVSGLRNYVPGHYNTDVVCTLCRNSYSATFMVSGTNR